MRNNASKDSITGSEAEKWFKQFSASTGIQSQQRFNLGRLINLLVSEVPKRLEDARDRLYQAFPEGNAWINQILLAKKEPKIPNALKQDFSLHLLDVTVGIDSIINFQDSNGKTVTVAVDITINPSKEGKKFRVIQGLPGKRDKPGQNRNKNINTVRKTLGIDKHLVLVLGDHRSLLPSYEKLMAELQAFALGDSLTASINLKNLQPHETLGQQRNPSQLYHEIYPSHQHLPDMERLKAIAQQSIEQGKDVLFTQKVLLNDPFLRGFPSQKAANTIALNISKGVAPIPEQLVYKVARFLVKNRVPNQAGLTEFQGKNYLIQSIGKSLTVTALDGRGIIFQVTDGKFVSKLQPKDNENFRAMSKVIDSKIQKLSQTRNLKPKRPPRL